MGIPSARNVVLTMVVGVLIMVVADSDSPKQADPNSPTPADSNSLEPNRQMPFTQWRVHIMNVMASGEPLFVHCKSKDDDLGPQNIVFNQEFWWQFRENLFSSTMFWCYFSSSHGHAEFEVFWPEGRGHNWLADHCGYSDCFWMAMDDGIYLLNIVANATDYKNDWVTAR